MVVRTLCDGRAVTGIYIGTRNARRNFSRRMQSVELLLDHLHIHCELAPAFWKGEPQILDGRLGDWLEAKVFHGRSCRTPAPMALLPAGTNTFRLLPFRPSSISWNRLVRIGAVAGPAERTATKPQCSITVCRSRDFIGCAVNAAPRFRSPESPA